MQTTEGRQLVQRAREALKAGDAEGALELARRIPDDDAASLDALEIKSLVAIHMGDEQTAEIALRRAILANPRLRWPYADLARLLLKSGRADEALEVSRAALGVDADNPDAHALLGAMLSQREVWPQAQVHFERAISIAGPHPHLLTGLGKAQLRRGQLAQARRSLDAAVRAGGATLEPLALSAEVEERLGNFDTAEKLLDQAAIAARAEGTDVELQRSVLLARMGRVEAALALLDHKPDLSGAARLQRGRLLERVGRYAEAWRDWATGKQQLARTRGTRYQAAEVAAQTERLADLTHRSVKTAATRDDVPQPIFIVGFPRSGTTLVEQILASHSAIRAGGELPFAAELCGLAEESVADQAGADRATQVRDQYLARALGYGLLESGAAFFTDKMPTNDVLLPVLRRAFPASPVINVRRHPLDVLTSVMAHDMTHGFNCGYRLEDAARHLALVDELVDRYRNAGLGPTHELRYEDLVAQQESVTRALMDAVGISMEPPQLEFHRRSEVSPTPSYAQVREPMNDRSMGRWRHFARELEPILPLVAKPLERGGYAG